MADGLLEAVRGLWLADPGLGPKPLLAKLREQQPDLGAGNKEVREALAALKAERGIREPQSADGLQEAVGHATVDPSADDHPRPQVWGGKAVTPCSSQMPQREYTAASVCTLSTSP